MSDFGKCVKMLVLNADRDDVKKYSLSEGNAANIIAVYYIDKNNFCRELIRLTPNSCLATVARDPDTPLFYEITQDNKILIVDKITPLGNLESITCYIEVECQSLNFCL